MSAYFPVRWFLCWERFLFLQAILSLSLCVLPVFVPGAQAGEVTLAWDDNQEPDLAGYRIYYGEATRSYSCHHDVGRMTHHTIVGLEAGMTYYFAATAYDRYGNESGFSEELVYRIPPANHPPMAAEGSLAAVNRAPVAQNGTLSTPQGTRANRVLIASDPDGDSLTYTLASNPAKGVVAITNHSTGSYTYTPNAGAIGDDSFMFQVKDTGNLTGTAAIAVTITPVNQPPVASNVSLSIAQGIPVTAKLAASDPNGDALTYSLVSAAQLGSVALNPGTGTFTYTPNAGSSGTDTFSFKANDGKADSNTATVTVTISAHVSVRLEAEQGELTSPMVSLNDTTASGGKCIWVADGKGNLTDPLKAGGQAVYTFDVPVAGNYRVWARVMANTTADNSFFVAMDYDPYVTWNTALAGKNTWAWDVVKDRNRSDASTFPLSAGTHTLVIKQMEDGTKIDAIVVTTQPAWIPETIYGDAEDGTIDGWDVFDASPSGATVTNVFDTDRNNRVIRVKGSKTNNGYRLRSSSYSDWANQSQFVIEWKMKYAEAFILYVEVQTTKGYCYFQYEALSKDYLGRSSQVRLGLGTDVRNGQWHTFVRDLQADLDRAQPGVKIVQVNAFSIRGSGLVDDVKLRATR